MKIFFFLLGICFSLNFQGQSNIKTVFYNLLNYDNDFESRSKTTHLATILSEINPDLFMVCELKSETASNYLFDNAILPSNPNFKKAPFKKSESPATSLLQMVYYNSEKLTLQNTTVLPTRIRDINHYKFLVNNTEITLEVFVTHLKASRGIDNRFKRLSSVEVFTDFLNTLPKDSNIVFAGDFNFYTSNEEGFQKIIDSNNAIEITDPIDRLCPVFPNDNRDYYNDDFDNFYFWNNRSFADVHSQSTRRSSLSDGSGGGMDDRFDFILLSKNLTSSNNFFYQTNSYETIGNNKNCYNSSVNDTFCFGKYSQNLRNALYSFSDHLPISLNLQVSEPSLSTSTNYPISFLNSNVVTNNLMLILGLQKIKKIVIYNRLGQKVLEYKVGSKKKIEINTLYLNRGIYYVKADGFSAKKFIKI